ncbi:HesA/MoeB/ThiF family protein [Agromyces sp. NPDC058104]|uniref:HesA/MoeB/ThiF family protein n=1 Tax=Agromyces sp. NPDC058104 TaxID=3346342 RepID=UPI0036DED01B
MAERTMTWTVRMSGEHWAELSAQLFPGDRDEHGAVLRCSIATTPTETRVLVREVIPAIDGLHYLPGTRGYRKLDAGFILDTALDFAEDKSVYLAVHCHGGKDRVAFSDVDNSSHERGYPGLLELIGAPIVGALVFAENAVAGDLWLADGGRVPLDRLIITDPVRRELTPTPTRAARAGEEYNRQALMFGDRGQEILARQKIAIVGLGGAGSLINELLARAGVGQLVLIDDDIVEPSNLSRIVGATRADARAWTVREDHPSWLRRLGRRLASKKVHVAERVARQAHANIQVDAVVGTVQEPRVAALLRDCDHIFLAADSATARLVVNAVAHQYLIPATQVGAKITVDKATGTVEDVFAVSRLVIPGRGCLRCNGLISPDRLRQEATDPEQLRREKYVEGETIHAPSVITLNAVATSHAVNQWLMSVTGLGVGGDEITWMFADARTGEFIVDEPRKDPDCRYCGPGRYGLGDSRRLPTKLG